MDELRTVEVDCPSCGQVVEIVVDCSVGSQRYIEDCPVCCRPMDLTVTIDHEGDPTVQARGEDE